MPKPNVPADVTPSPPIPGVRSSLKTRLKVTAFVGLAIIAAWLYYAVNQVLTLHDVTLDIQRTTDLRERVGDAKNALAEAEDALDRYTQNGQGYDLSRLVRGGVGERHRDALRPIPVVIVTAKELTAREYAELSGSAQRVIRKASDPSRLVADVLRAVQEEKTA